MYFNSSFSCLIGIASRADRLKIKWVVASFSITLRLVKH